MKPETCYWENGEFKGSTKGKIKGFLRNDLIHGTEYLGVYKVHPEKGRNTIHEVDFLRKTCTCQVGTSGLCTHIRAVLIRRMQEDNGRKIPNEKDWLVGQEL